MKKCRICQTQMEEGGLRLSEVDSDALARWWSKCLHTKLDRRTLKGAWSCRQCVSNARSQHSNEEQDEDLIWWPLEDADSSAESQQGGATIFGVEMSESEVATFKADFHEFQNLDLGEQMTKIYSLACKIMEKTETLGKLVNKLSSSKLKRLNKH